MNGSVAWSACLYGGSVIFVHHSTGQALIREGNVRPLFAERGYQFWDHGYNSEGLVRPDGKPANAQYDSPGNRRQGNTDEDGLAELFSQPVPRPSSNAFSRLLQHEVIVVKSCFPNSACRVYRPGCEYVQALLSKQFIMWRTQ